MLFAISHGSTAAHPRGAAGAPECGGRRGNCPAIMGGLAGPRRGRALARDRGNKFSSCGRRMSLV
jgi:hypothetical protein